jgi:hypothetical protein
MHLCNQASQALHFFGANTFQLNRQPPAAKDWEILKNPDKNI